MRICFFIFCLILLTKNSFTQLKNWGIELKPKYGFLIAHRTIMTHIPKEHSLGGEFSLFLRPSGKKSWHHAYQFPTIGITAYGSSVGNMELLGTHWGSYMFIEFPFAKKQSI
jgi:hypothetical protein